MFSTVLAIRTSAAANRLIYYAQKLPWIGRSIPDSVYASLRAKRAISVIALVLSVVWGIVSKLLYLGLLVYLPVATLGADKSPAEQWQLFLHVYLLLSFFVAGVSGARVLEPKREKYIAVKLMRVSPDRYMRATLGYRYATFFLYYIPALIVCTALFGVSALYAVWLSAAVTLWRVGCEWLHLALFDKTEIVAIRNNAVVWLSIGLGGAAAYVPLLVDGIPPVGAQLPGVPAWFFAAAAGCYGAWRLARYRGYREAVDAVSKRDDPLLNIGQLMTDAKKADVRMKDSDISRVNLPSAGAGGGDTAERVPGNSADSVQGEAAYDTRSGTSEDKQGYAFLNELFFSRHRSLIRQPVLKRLAILGAVAVAGVGLALAGVVPDAVVQSDWGTMLSFLAFVMSFLSVGERVCRAMFYNCDLSLMRYGFYRSDADRHFRIRLRRMIGLNLIIAAALGVALTLVALTAVLVSGKTGVGMDLLLMWASVLALSVFFSVHHLFMYYFFQPYTTELNMKNPLFFTVNMIVSAACGIGIWVRVPAMPFTAAVCVLTLAYMVVALTVVRRSGYRTFRVK